MTRCVRRPQRQAAFPAMHDLARGQALGGGDSDSEAPTKTPEERARELQERRERLEREEVRRRSCSASGHPAAQRQSALASASERQQQRRRSTASGGAGPSSCLARASVMRSRQPRQTAPARASGTTVSGRPQPRLLSILSAHDHVCTMLWCSPGLLAVGEVAARRPCLPRGGGGAQSRGGEAARRGI